MGGDTQSRSILLVTLEEVDYLLVGLGDGHLVSFPIQVQSHTCTHAADDCWAWVAALLSSPVCCSLWQTPTDGGAPWLGACKKVSLGTHPITLTPFTSGEGSA